MNRPMIFGRDVLNKGHCAAWLGVTLDGVDDLIDHRGMPHVMIGGKPPVLFRAPSLLEWRARYVAQLQREAAEEADRLRRDELRRTLLPRVEDLRSSMEACDVGLANCDECQGCLAGFSARHRRWASAASDNYGVCVSAIAAWAGDWTCPLCGKDMRSAPRLDHNHATGEPRGVICGRCNYALSFIDCPDWLERAITYVSRDSDSARWARVSEPRNTALNDAEPPETTP